MKKLFLFSFVILFALQATAQTSNAASEKDPAATAILKKLRARFDSFKSMTADFSLEIDIPELTTETQKGKLWQEGEKYRAELDNRSLISDGDIVWVYLGGNKEVQINCADEFGGEGMISPKDLLTIYEQEDYAYYLSNEFRENGKVIQQIEFKPTDRDSEYSKLRLTIDKSTLDIIRVKVFAKDGSRFTLKMDNLQANKSIDAAKFRWQKSECPECYVEDLRIDC